MIWLYSKKKISQVSNVPYSKRFLLVSEKSVGETEMDLLECRKMNKISEISEKKVLILTRIYKQKTMSYYTLTRCN